MKVGILGGGIAGLTAAYYLKKFAYPISQVVLFESSNRFGGWLNSMKFRDEERNRDVLFETGPRTLRFTTAFKELNTLALVDELKLTDEIDLIHSAHPSARNRFIYVNGKINLIKPSFFFKNEVFGAPLLSLLFKEFTTPPRSSDVKDESAYDFVSRRLGSHIAETMVDPLLKGICGGDIRQLSAATLLKGVYDGEVEHGGILKALFNKRKQMAKPDDDEQKLYSDLVELRNRPYYRGLNVWRFKNGIDTLSGQLVANLKAREGVELKSEEPCLNVEFKNDRALVKTTKDSYEFDFLISGLYSRDLANTLSDEHSALKTELNKIDTVNMVVINLYFDKNILPVQGFGYLVPTKENSPILGCIFDSVFDKDSSNHSTITLMMGGALYKKYITQEMENDQGKLLEFALGALKKQINFDVEPKLSKVSIQRNCIPQYNVGHLDILKNIKDYLDDKDLDGKLHLVGSSYDGFGINDIIFNSRNLCQKKIAKKFK